MGRQAVSQSLGGGRKQQSGHFSLKYDTTSMRERESDAKSLNTEGKSNTYTWVVKSLSYVSHGTSV